MCKAFSGLVKRNCDVVWQFAVDSHEALIKKAELTDLEADPNNREWVRFELSPHNGSYMKPDNWVLKIDEEKECDWITDAHKQACQDAFVLWKKELDKVFTPLDVKNPLIGEPKKPRKKHLALLKKWASVGASVRDSVWASVWDSVCASVWASVRDSVRDSVGDSVRDSVGDSVWASVGASVRASVWASVRDSVGAQTGKMFSLKRNQWKYTEKIKCKGYPFQSCVDLWNAGFVPSFDGKTWRLHSGEKATVVYQMERKG